MGILCSAAIFDLFLLSLECAVTNTHPETLKTKSWGLFLVLTLTGNGNVPYLGLGGMHLSCVHSIWFTFIKH